MSRRRVSPMNLALALRSRWSTTTRPSGGRSSDSCAEPATTWTPSRPPRTTWRRQAVLATGASMLDVFLGGMTRLDLRDELAESGIHIPVVFITAHQDVGVVARAATGVPCLRKPFDEELLFEAISAVTGSAAAIDSRPNAVPSSQACGLLPGCWPLRVWRSVRHGVGVPRGAGAAEGRSHPPGRAAAPSVGRGSLGRYVLGVSTPRRRPRRPSVRTDYLEAIRSRTEPQAQLGVVSREVPGRENSTRSSRSRGRPSTSSCRCARSSGRRPTVVLRRRFDQHAPPEGASGRRRLVGRGVLRIERTIELAKPVLFSGASDIADGQDGTECVTAPGSGRADGLEFDRSDGAPARGARRSDPQLAAGHGRVFLRLSLRRQRAPLRPARRPRPGGAASRRARSSA